MTESVEFLAYHRPVLEDGDYRITVRQTIEAKDKISSDNSWKTSRAFAVQGERFRLAPSEILSVFPPPGSLGDYSDSFAHVTLARSTLPWERTAAETTGDDDPPWLAVLLFDEHDPPPKALQVAAGDLVSEGVVDELETGQDLTDPVTVIDVPEHLLDEILPTAGELELLAHVRLSHGSEEAEPEEVATVIGNRLPVPGHRCTAHLVSLEGRYETGSGAFDSSTGSSPSSEPGCRRLISLKSWSFACVSPHEDFKNLLLHADAGTLRLPKPPAGDAARPGSDLDPETYLGQGFVALPHRLRNGESTVSWYRGPFTPGPEGLELQRPALAADELLRLDPKTGLFDASYAAAWQLGRLMMLGNPGVSTALHAWKRTHRQQALQGDEAVRNLPFVAVDPDLGLPPPVVTWFEALARLEGLPFAYLVPLEAMLPPESIRFFQLDLLWLECLLDGAFSIGRVTSADADHDDALWERLPKGAPSVSGFLLRSDAVSGWPHLEVDAAAAQKPPLPTGNKALPLEPKQKLAVLRMDRLAPNVLLCLFAGVAKTVDLYLHPGKLHFGFDKDSSEVFKDPKKIPWATHGSSSSSGPGTRVVDVTEMAHDISAGLSGNPKITSAEYALNMIQKAEYVRFTVAAG